MKCPFCHEEMEYVTPYNQVRAARCPGCYLTMPYATTDEQAGIKYHQTIKKIRDFFPERISMGANVEKARREINVLRNKKKPTSADLNRMETLVSYSHSYVNFAGAVREAEIVNSRIESFIVGMQIMEEKLWKK